MRSGFIKKGTSKWTGLGSWAFSDGCIEEFVRSFDRRSLDTFTFFYSSFQFIFKFDSLSSHLLSFLCLSHHNHHAWRLQPGFLLQSLYRHRLPAASSSWRTTLPLAAILSLVPLIQTSQHWVPATLAEECTSWFVRKNGVTVIENGVTVIQNGLPLTSKPSAKC